MSLLQLRREQQVQSVQLLTQSGDLVNDAMRLAATQGDGLAYPQRMTGIYGAYTNLENSAGADTSFESGTAGYTTGGTNTIAASAAQAKFGAQSCLATYQDNATLLDIALTLTAAAHSAKRWLYIPTAYDGGGVSVQFANFAGATGTAAVAANMSLRDQWQEIAAPNYVIAAGDLAGNVQVVNTGAAPTAGQGIYIDGCQTVASAIDLPFTPTTATAGRIQIPSTGMSATAGAVAMRWKAGATSSIIPFSWRVDGTNKLEFLHDGTQYLCNRTNNNTSCGVLGLTANTDYTSIGRWNATHVAVGHSGGAFTGAANAAIAIAATTMDIGTRAGTTWPLNGNIHWAAFYGPGGALLGDGDSAYINSLGNNAQWQDFPLREHLVAFWDGVRGNYLSFV